MAHKEHYSVFFSVCNAFMPTSVFFALLNLLKFQRKFCLFLFVVLFVWVFWFWFFFIEFMLMPGVLQEL